MERGKDDLRRGAGLSSGRGETATRGTTAGKNPAGHEQYSDIGVKEGYRATWRSRVKGIKGHWNSLEGVSQLCLQLSQWECP